MDCFLSKNMKMKLHNRRIDKFLKNENIAAKQKLLLLVLGIPESGKSTFVKQMRIFYGKGYSDEEKRDFIKYIHQHILTAIQSIIKAMDTLNIDYEFQKTINSAKLVSHMETVDLFDKLFFSTIKTIWNDVGIQECYDRRREYELSDSTRYFLAEVDRIALQTYVPSEEDILRVRVPTTGIVEYSFIVDTTQIRLVDVGGLHTERMKWLDLFEKSHAILFIAALSDYNKKSLNPNHVLQNRMETSKELFRKIVASPWFQNSSFILFLNKKDLFAEELKHSHLEDYFPEYDGPNNDTKAASEFIYNMYSEQNPDPEKFVYSHFTCCTESESIRNSFEAMHYVGVLRHLNDFKLI